MRQWAGVTPRRRLWLQLVDGGAITALGLSLSGWIALSGHKVDEEFVSRLYVAAAALIGTIVVLAVNLSLIPIQRAAEQYAPSILRVFREDRVTRALIVALASSSLALFALAAPGLFPVAPLRVRAAMPIVFLAAAFDLLRWHHRRMTRLLDPSEAISRLKARVVRHIDGMQTRVARFARLLHRQLSLEERQSTAPSAIETQLYLSDPAHTAPLIHWINELSEATSKALRRGDDLGTLVGVSAIDAVAKRYLERRNDNLALQSAPDGVMRSDAFDLLEPALASLKQVVSRAASDKRERVATAAILALADLTASTAARDGKRFKVQPGGLAWLPLGYLIDSIRIVQKEGLADSALRGSRSLLDLVISLPRGVGVVEVHLSVVSALRDVTLGFLTAGQGAIGRESLKHLLQVNWVLLEQGHWQLKQCLAESLRAIKALAPIVFVQEQAQPFALTWLPLSPAFDLAEPLSLPYLVGKAATRMKADPERPWVNPYSEFITLNEVIWRHLRELAETPGCGRSSLMWHIGRTVGYIARIHRDILAKEPPDTSDHEHQSELAQGVGWYVASLWAAFKTTPPQGVQWAEDVIEQISSIGMRFLAAGFVDVVGTCGSAMRTITQSCYANAKSPYDIADLLMGIWKLRMFAALSGHGKVVADLDKALERLPGIEQEQWNFVEEALSLRKRQFDDDLQGDPMGLSMSEPSMLIFRERQRQAAKRANSGGAEPAEGPGAAD